MIVLYSKFDIDRSLNREVFFERVFTWINGMKDAPDEFRNLSWEGENSFCKREGKNCLDYEIDEENGLTAFRLKVVDEHNELWTTDYVLDEYNMKFQIRLAREKGIVSAYYSSRFRIPYFLRKLIEEGYGGIDVNLPVIDKPIYLDESNIGIIADLINRKIEYMMPVVYVSYLFDNSGYELDVEELAKDLAGCAHVIAEQSPEISGELRLLVNDENAYNGAIDVFFGKDSLRYLRFADKTSGQFRNLVSRAVYRRLAMLNIADDQSLTSIRIRNKENAVTLEKIDEYEIIKMELDELQEKHRDDLQQIEAASDEIDDYIRQINELKSQNQFFEAALKRKNQGTERQVSLSYSEEELYDDEIKTIVMDCIRRQCKGTGDDEKKWRPYHVLKNILETNEMPKTRDKLRAKLLNILKRSRLKSQDLKELKDLGFTLEGSDHIKAKFHNDDRYMITIACTPGDHCEGENNAHDGVTVIFGKNNAKT